MNNGHYDEYKFDSTSFMLIQNDYEILSSFLNVLFERLGKYVTANITNLVTTF